MSNLKDRRRYRASPRGKAARKAWRKLYNLRKKDTPEGRAARKISKAREFRKYLTAALSPAKYISARRISRREAMAALPKNELKRRRYLSAKYGLGINEGFAIYESQNGKCAICAVKISFVKKDQKTVACLDHCHATGKPRGFLCNGCNTGLGGFRDTPEFLNKAVKYIEHHTPRSAHH